MLMTPHGKKQQACKRPRRRHALWLFFFLFLSRTGEAQHLSLTLNNASLEKAFREIEKQTDYRFVYTKEMLAPSLPVTIRLSGVTLYKLLETVFNGQPLEYGVDEKFITVRVKPVPLTAAQKRLVTVQGRVTGEDGLPLPGATVQAKGAGKQTATAANGSFTLSNLDEQDRLLLTSIGYAPKEIEIKSRTHWNIQLSVLVNELDETIVMAYGTTTNRLKTGNITRVTAADIEKQPVSNPLAALQGRVPGLIVTQGSGVPGASFKVEIRGRTSLDLNLSKNDPLIIIDGVPFEAGNTPTNQFISAANNPNAASEGGLSPLNTINTADIESIEVLKDADATAIYGSRGANGVILITTKKGRPGRTKLTLGMYTGWSRVTRSMKMLNTQQYVQMRKEAFANDGITPTVTNAPDIMLWDTTRYTDFAKLLFGNTARNNNAQLSLSGGSQFTSFSVSGNYHHETTVFPGSFADKRASASFNLNHRSSDNKWGLSLSALYASDDNQLMSVDVSQYMRLPPNLLLYDSAGGLAWAEKGVFFSSVNGFNNPLSQLLQKFNSVNENFSSGLNLRYEIFKGLTVRSNLGFNRFNTDETSLRPKSSFSPAAATLASASFASSQIKNWIIEPQAEYSYKNKNLKLVALLGTTFQQKQYNSTSILASNYTNDLLLRSVAAAGTVTSANYHSLYRYNALFGRLTVNAFNKYLLNLSARRDGSSRFGPQKQFANFGAVGAGWILSEEKWVKKQAPVLSFAKLRTSFGLTGNDQLGDYKFYDLWTNSLTGYMSSPGLVPTGLFNPAYNWESVRKLEAAAELGFAKDRIMLSVSWYRHRSSNQLVNYNLPVQTGFTTVVRNLPALVQNTGLEIVLSTKAITKNNWSWNSSFNLTVPRNKLIAFPGLATSNYFTTYVEGASLSAIRRLKFLGINPATGIYQYQDVNNDGLLTAAADYQYLGDRDPRFYGGWQNTITKNEFQLDIVWQFVKQKGTNYLANFYSMLPGAAYNQPVLVLDRWQKSGDRSGVQLYSTLSAGAAATASNRLNISDAIYSDASFIRLKTLAFSFNFLTKWTTKWNIEKARFYINAQNLFTITRYVGADPENQRFFQVPPLRTIVTGFEFTF